MNERPIPLCRRACPEGLSAAKESNGPAHSLRSAQRACDNHLMNDNAPIDRFVEILNERGFESLPEQEVPPELRIGVPNDFGWCDCRQQSLGGRAGTELGALPIPALYLSLISPLSQDNRVGAQ